MSDLHVVQRFYNGVWKTIVASTFEPDCDESFTILKDYGRPGIPIRQVTVSVSDLDFIMVQARDFRVTKTDGL